MVPLVAFNFGARHKQRILQIVGLACVYATGMMLGGLALAQLFPDKLLLLFNATGHMLELGIPAMRIISLSYPFAALGIIISSVFQALGRGWESLCTVVFRQLVILLPAAWLLSLLPNPDTIWWSFLIACGASLGIAGILLARTYKQKIKDL